MDEVVDIIHRLRRSPETVRTLPSTNHAVLRLLLDTDSTHVLLKLLSDPLNYGVFPDHYVANMLMDSYIKKEDFTGKFAYNIARGVHILLFLFVHNCRMISITRLYHIEWNCKFVMYLQLLYLVILFAVCVGLE